MTKENKPKWLIEDYDERNKFDELAKEVRRQGMDCHLIKPGDETDLDLNDIYGDRGCVIFQGSLQLGNEYRRQNSNIFFPWCDLKNLECTTYYAHWGEFLLHRNYMMLPLNEVKRRKDELFIKFDGSFFIRPNGGLKAFTGQVINYATFEKDWDQINFYEPEPSLLTIVAPKRDIQREWRFVIGANKVVAHSLYSGSQKRTVVEEYAELIATRPWQPNPMYTLDICESDDKLHLLEVNSFSFSGKYDCDKKAIVTAASKIAVKEWNKYHDI